MWCLVTFWLFKLEVANNVIKKWGGIICISDRIGSNSRDMRFTFSLSAPSLASPLEIGVKTEEDLKQWVEAIRSCASRTAVCALY